MHTLNRILTLLILCVVLLPPATFALVSLNEKNETQSALQDAIGDAVHTYQRRGTLEQLKKISEKTITQEADRLVVLERQKFELRRAIAQEMKTIASVRKRYGIVIASRASLKPIIDVEKRRIARLMYRRSILQTSRNSSDAKSVILRMAFNVASTEMGDILLERTQTKTLRDLTAADQSFENLESLKKEHAHILANYISAQIRKKNAAATIERSAKELTGIQEIMEDVHTQVLKIQGELARIDARLKEKAERLLIEKGLLKAEDIGKADIASYHQQFSWPVYGRVSAGFMLASYKKFFGVDHHGMDIVVPQETPVATAANGVIFLVRDGGEKGYSYILVGHRGGYATLYGHVSKALVSAGQEVNVGDVIALSGGAPGTHGAGPMTTASHLHFEVIKNGVNVDPKSVLP